MQEILQEIFSGLLSNLQAIYGENWQLYFLAAFAIFIVIVGVRFGFRSRLIHLNDKFVSKLKWKVFELNFPRENLKSPQSMEQVFTSLHGIFSFGLNNVQVWVTGDVEPWISFEIVGQAHEVKFYARCQAGHKNVLEAALFSQYPEIEINEVPDYVESLPPQVPDETYDLFGTDMILARADAYPIKTYEQFEAPKDERRLDPIATIAEAASNLEEDEIILIQLNIRPINDSTNPWKNEGKKIVDKILDRKEPDKPPGPIAEVGQFFGNLSAAWQKPPEWGQPKKEKEFKFTVISHGEQEITKAIDEKASKIAFETVIRFIYVDRKDSFTGRNISAVMGAFAQYSAGNFNALMPNFATLTKGTKVGGRTKKGGKWPWSMFLRKSRLLKRKRLLYQAYKDREMPRQEHLMPKKLYTGHYHKRGHLYTFTSVLGVHELATIYHPPGEMVVSQKIGQLPAKKTGPPLGLPIIE